ncbi:hypothetical protein [Mycobacteroides abscessus]|uniref:hypothetical protein n=1 Tax=Mycobacteroides abscessus TaxID=36809 RepID=UPI00308087A4
MTGTTRGTIRSWMSEFREEIPHAISYNINALGADGGFDDIHTSYRIYRIPDGMQQGDKISPTEWIQTAGTAERLTVEIKKQDSDGIYRQYVVGRSGGAEEQDETESIQFGDFELPVRPSEVLTAADAIDLFLEFYDYNAIPPVWHLRPLSAETLAAQGATAT